MRYITYFDQIHIADVTKVGGKNASLGEMITQLSSQKIRVPDGFAITADAYWHYITENKLLKPMKQIMSSLHDTNHLARLHTVGSEIRKLIMHGHMPHDLAQEIITAYHELSRKYKKDNVDVAVRSSATAEDLPNASFAGQQDTFLNVVGEKKLLEACKKSMASLFTDRAIIYRIDKGFDHFKVALSIGVQKMIRSDKAVSGVAFSLDTESGFKDVVMIEASYGLGESIVQGLVTPDEYIVHKPTLELGYIPIIKKTCGDKKTKIVYEEHRTKTVKVTEKDRQQFALSDKEIIELAQYVVIIEKYYSKLKKSWSPMDIEWAKDGHDGKLYIVQARPETVYAGKQELTLQHYTVKGENKKNAIVTGLSIGHKIVSGSARVVKGAQDIGKVHDGDIIVTPMTDPDWVPAMKRAAGIITDRGGRTCHAAIVSRELGIPAIVGTETATSTIKNGDKITIDCSSGATGIVYKGALKYTIKNILIADIPKPKVDVMVNIADPDSAFQTSFLPVVGVGLARLEFIITNVIKIHPMALMYPERVKDKKTKEKIKNITASYPQKTDFFIERLAQGIGMIAAGFYPRPVSVRLSDFKSNEYRNLIGGVYFEPVEENPMIGFRGASRYYNDLYKEAFALECKALMHVREVMGLKNIKIMIPFVRTVHEAKRVEAEMAKHGLKRNKDLEFVMMCEVPSNVIMINELSSYFDGFSIGSNDLTQLVLGVDRDSTILADLFDERDEAVKRMMALAIKGAHQHKRYIGICGQAPSDYPEIAKSLIKEGIDSLSLNVDSVLPFLMKKYQK
ncbi:MAG TPA: phosphoenolpyruvate synthase [Candidatus Babeliales bacterium]|jgi:pyruvate,water dikinase|nr:phosphoenolpyruvate synthase [Candidatus Babeliales bacterium]